MSALLTRYIIINRTDTKESSAPYTITQISNSAYTPNSRNVTQAALREDKNRRFSLHAYFTAGNPSSAPQSVPYWHYAAMSSTPRHASISIVDHVIFKSYEGAKRKVDSLADYYFQHSNEAAPSFYANVRVDGAKLMGGMAMDLQQNYVWWDIVAMEVLPQYIGEASLGDKD